MRSIYLEYKMNTVTVDSRKLWQGIFAVLLIVSGVMLAEMWLDAPGAGPYIALAALVTFVGGWMLLLTTQPRQVWAVGLFIPLVAVGMQVGLAHLLDLAPEARRAWLPLVLVGAGLLAALWITYARRIGQAGSGGAFVGVGLTLIAGAILWWGWIRMEDFHAVTGGVVPRTSWHAPTMFHPSTAIMGVGFVLVALGSAMIK
jgi:hypothetical protein